MIVAGNMSRLADQKTRAAQEAELSRRQETEQRDRAEKAQQQAEASFARARRAVDDSFTKVSESKLLDVPGLQPLRLDLLKSALAFYDEFLKERGDDAAIQADLLQTRVRTGRILNILGRFDDARAAFQTAASGYEQALRDRHNHDDLDLKAGLAEALHGAASSRTPTSFDVLIQALHRSIALLEEVVAVRPGASRFKKDLAGYYNELGLVATDAGNPLVSSDAYERCVTLRLELADETPDDPGVLEGLGASLFDLVASNGFRSSAAQRIRLVRQAREFVRAALQVHPNDVNTLLRVCVLTRVLAYDLRSLGRQEQAVEELRGVIGLLEQKARENPEVPGPLSGYRWAAQHLADLLKEGGRTGEAAGVLRQAFALAETLARENPEAAASQENCVNVAYDAATGLKDLKRPDEAIRCLMAARPALDRIPRATGDRLVEDASRRLRFAELMARCRPQLAADEQTAREGLLDQAMAGLRQAAAAGSRDAARLQAEAIYDPIRGRPDYPALLAAVEAASKAPGATAGPPEVPSHVRPTVAAVARSQAIRLARAGILAAIGQVEADAGRGEKGLEYLRQALPLQQELVEERPADIERRADLAGIQLSTGKALVDLGRADSAIARLDAARGIYEALGDVSRDMTRFRPERAAIFMALGRAYSDAGRGGDSETAWERAQRELTQAIEEKPEDPQRRIDRALCFIRRRHESLAASDLRGAWSLDPEAGPSPRSVVWASLVLFTGDREEYRRGCRQLLERFGQADDGYSRLNFAITAGLGEDAVDDWSRIVRHTQETVNDIRIKESYHYHDLALVYLRAGRFEAALRALDESDRLGSSWPARTLNDPVRAIVCHRLGRQAEARSALDKARQWADQNEKKGPPDLTALEYVGDWYRHLILLREAEALIVYDPIFPADPFAR